MTTPTTQHVDTRPGVRASLHRLGHHVRELLTSPIAESDLPRLHGYPFNPIPSAPRERRR